MLALPIMQSYVMLISLNGRRRRSLQESAVPLLSFHTAGVGLAGSSLRLLLLLVALVICDDCVDCVVEDLVDSVHLLATALHITRSHLLGNGHALFLRNGGESLSFEEVDACTFASKIGLQANEDKRSVRAEV